MWATKWLIQVRENKGDGEGGTLLKKTFLEMKEMILKPGLGIGYERAGF